MRLPGSVDEPFLMIDYTVNTACTSAANGAAQSLAFARVRAQGERWAHQNRLGSVVAVTSSAGAVLERHRYGPYGEIGGSTSGFPFRFTGQKLDPETGLYYYKARFYDPEVGRFLQTDPIGYEDQMNFYAYGPNDPTNGRDVTGEAWGKALRLAVKTVKYKGNVVKAARETAVEVGQAAAALTDGKLDARDAEALVDLVSPVSVKEAKAGVRAARAALKRSASAGGRRTSRYGGPDYAAGHGRIVLGSLARGTGLGAGGGALLGGLQGYHDGGWEGAASGAKSGAMVGGGIGFAASAAVGIIAGATAGEAAGAIAGTIVGAQGIQAQEFAKDVKEEFEDTAKR